MRVYRTDSDCSLYEILFENFLLFVLCFAVCISTTLGMLKDGWPYGFQDRIAIVAFVCLMILGSIVQNRA